MMKYFNKIILEIGWLSSTGMLKFKQDEKGGFFNEILSFIRW